MTSREAIASIWTEVAATVVEQVASEGATASSGLAGVVARAYGEDIQSTFPIAVEAMTLDDGPERAAKLDALASAIRGVSERHHVPRLVERGLVAVAFGVASGLIRRRAPSCGFTPEALDVEMSRFRDEVESRLFALR